ncbi:MAG TPA: hypothetical protein PK170_07460, partial [Anaerolineae bacterium]|nr:hypothetical protein [Anaerolineae bacterium]
MVLSARVLIAGLALALAVLGLWTFAPALSGDFLFDDYANLATLGSHGGVRDLESLLLYLSSGIADATGRPVAVASFLFDARDWPAAPGPFLRTNLAIHLVNGLLVLALAWQLLGHATTAVAPTRRALVASLATACWLVHPLQAGIVPYIVQRHATLATGFVLLGLLAWLALHRRLVLEQPGRRWPWALAFVASLGLATLSKPIGLLLPLLVLVLHATVLPLPLPQRAAALRRAQAWLLWPPMLALGAYLLLQLPDAIESSRQLREYSLGERLLSQPRVLLDYLRRLLLPLPGDDALFVDQFQPSRGLLTPWTTLPAAVLVIGAGCLMWLTRRRWPLLALAGLFFLAGHALESGPVNLELAFPHRNYLPAALLFLPISAVVLGPRMPAALAGLIAVVTVAVLALASHQQARLWGNAEALAMDWSARFPESARAQVHAATWDVWWSRPEPGLRRLAPWRQRRPEVQVALTLIDLECLQGAVAEPTLDYGRRALSQDRRGANLAVAWLRQSPDRLISCRQQATAIAHALLQAALANPWWQRNPAQVRDLAVVEA